MTLDPMSQAVVNAITASGVVPFRQYHPVEARNNLQRIRAPRPAVPAHPMAALWEETIPTPAGGITVRIHQPRLPAPGEAMGAVIYFHGGGFFAGSLDDTDLLVRQIALDGDVVVFNIDYHLAPEATFPVAVNDAYAALEWVAAEAARFGVDPTRLVVAGDSSGGNLAIVTCLHARDRRGPAIAGLVAIYPSVDYRRRAWYPSRTLWGGGEYFLIADDIEWMLDHYLPNPADREDWRASPILARSFAGLPPALIITASHDPLVDEGKAFADRLTEAGVPVEYACFDGTIHGFVSMAGVIPAGARAMKLICERIKAATLCVLLLLTLVSPAAAQYIIGARDDKAVRVDSVFRAFDRTDSPGCALGVYENGTIRYARGYGLASLEYSVPISPRTVLDVGSISKQFTAMAMLLLEKDGKLSLEDPIRKLYPEMPAYADRITWRRALSQTSGLRDLWSMWGQTGRTFAGDTVDALNVIFHSAEPNYEPGEHYLYTNTGWILAAQAVYRLTGKTLAQFAEERIFTPLGMRDTRFLVDRAAIIPNLAESYSPRDKSYRVQRNPYDGAIMGAGGIHTTVEDFGRWLNNYDAATVGGRDVITTMTTATRLNDGSPATSAPGLAYAVGLTVGTARGLPVVAHGGSWGGFRGHFLRFPDQRFAVATFCNLTTSGPDSLAQKVAAIYLGDRMAPDTVAAWAEPLGRAPRVDLPAAELRRLAGVWRNVERGEVRRTRMTGDSLVSDGTPPATYVPLGGGRFRLEGATEIRFEGDGPVPARMVVRTAAGTAIYARADTVALDAAATAEYVGEYRSDEIDVTHSWRVEKGQLVAYAGYRRLGVLEPSYRDGFTRAGSVIDVVRDQKGRITGFLVEAGRVRHLRFTRVRGSLSAERSR